MRRLSRGLIALTIAVALVLISALPAAADIRTDDPHHTHDGGSSGNAIWVTVGASGGAKRGYNNCPWQRGWPGTSGVTEIRSLPSLLDFVLANFPWPFGDTDDPATVELVPIGEADLDGDGEVDEDFIVPLLDDEDGHVIGETDGLNWFNDFLLRLIGTHDLGVFIADPNAGADPDDLTEDQLEGAHYQQSSRYPLVQRGHDPFDGVDLWWDPWFVAVEDETAACPAGVIYSPRINNPRILLPDLQSFVSELLPPAVPIMIPLDEEHDWAYVQVPTNFAVAGSSLQRQSAHAEVAHITFAGTVALWADIVAIPTHLVFDPGDGSDPVVCHLSEMGFDPDDPGDCSYVYLDSSNTTDSGVYEASVSVMWVGLYTDSTGVSRVVNIAPTSASFDIAVAEARPSGRSLSG